MPGPRSHASPSPSVSAGIVIAMLVMVVAPAAITLHSIRFPGKIVSTTPNPSPHGYTWSLSLFIIPILVIAVWFLPSEGLEIPQRAFWRTIGILAPVGFLLDFVFARWFFCFPNRGATPRIPAPALGHPVPIEEYIFYLSGFVMILLLYVWLSEYWLVAYSVPDYVGETRTMRRLFRFHPTSLLVGLVLIALSILFKKWISPLDDGWPGYFIVLMVGGLVPSMSFFPTTCRFINWRALSLTLFLVLLISLLWEATLALPYGWWNYQHRQMMCFSSARGTIFLSRQSLSGLPSPTGPSSFSRWLSCGKLQASPPRKRCWVHGNHPPLIAEFVRRQSGTTSVTATRRRPRNRIFT